MLLPQQRVLSAPQLPSHPSMALTLILFCFKKPLLLYLFIFSCSQVPNQGSTLCIPEVKAQNLNHETIKEVLHWHACHRFAPGASAPAL